MKGFFKRDLCLLRLGLWFYSVLIGGMLVVSGVFSRAGVLNYMVYFLMILGVEIFRSLFTYDAMNGWRAYAAAVPGGRRAMADARYVLALASALVLAVVMGLMTLLQRKSLPLWAAGFYGSAYLFTLSVTLPVGYRWDLRGRWVYVILSFVMIGVLGGIFTGVLDSARADLARGGLGADVGGFFTCLSLAMPLLGIGGMCLSWRISRKIVSRKEF